MALAIAPQPQHRPLSYDEFKEDFYNSHFPKIFGSTEKAETRADLFASSKLTAEKKSLMSQSSKDRFPSAVTITKR